METISPTRMNLLLKKEEIKAASVGVELLRNKRDVLLVEFFTCLKSLLSQREALDRQSGRALRSLIYALGLEGREKLSSFSFIRPKPPRVEIGYKNLLGLKMPEIVFESAGYEKNGGSTSTYIDEAKADFQALLSSALKILPQQLKLKRLGQEIKNTTRKVNSLEKYAIPGLYSQVKFIRESLEEREREDVFRLKRFKKRCSFAK